MTDYNYRDLCAELVSIADALDGGTPLISNQGQALDGYSALAEFRNVADRARAALAEPVAEPPAPPAEGEIAELVKYLRGVKSLHCQRAAELLEQLHSTPEPVAWMYKDEAYFNGKEWRENWEVTTSERLAVWKSAPEQPVPLYALPLPALENEK